MKTIILILTTFVLTLGMSAQVYQEDFESSNVGDTGISIGYQDFSNGMSEVTLGIGSNTSQVLTASNIVGGDKFLRSPLIDIQENEAYTINLDIASSSAVYFLRIRTEDAAGTNSLLDATDVILTVTNGIVNASNGSRVENVTVNTFGDLTATFTTPTGAVKAQFQLYQFGIQSIILDNVDVDLASPPIYVEDFEAATIGDLGSVVGYTDVDNGFSAVAQGMNGNATQVLLSDNIIGADKFLVSPLVDVEVGKSYQVKLDISTTNTAYLLRVRTEDAAGNNVLLPLDAVDVTTSVGTIAPTNASKVENLLPNSFSTGTATFTVPDGMTKAQFQLYQFGKNSFMIDDVTIREVETVVAPFWSSEAELGTLSGGANIGSGCGNASNQAFVRLFTSSANELSFSNINLNSGGSYDLNIDYFQNGAAAALVFYINGEFVKEATILPFQWCFEGGPGSTSISLPFKEGDNVLTIAAVEGKLSPLLDRFELSETPINDWFSEAEDGTLLGNATILSGCGNASESGIVKLDNVVSNRLLFDDVNVQTSGLYKLNFSHFGKPANKSLNILVNGVVKQLANIPGDKFCSEGGSTFTSTTINLNAGANTIEFRPIGSNTPTPLIDWVETKTFDPPLATLTITKQRVMPSETIEILISTGDKPVDITTTFPVVITGLADNEYSISATEVTIDAGMTAGSIEFTPGANSAESAFTVAITSDNPDVFVENSSVDGLVTLITKIIYVSSSEGDDTNDGYSEATAIQSLAKATLLGQISGDQVLFKSDDTFFGQLVVSASGTVANPLVVSSYGSGEQPILDGSVAADGNGSFLETIRIINKSNIEVSNLHIKNPRTTSRFGVSDSQSSGINIFNNGDGILSNFRFKNLTVTDVFSIDNIGAVDFDAILVTGIFMETTSSNPGSVKYIEDVIVEDCYFSRVGKIGFWSRRRFVSADTQVRDSVKNRDIIFRNNTVFENGGSGIVLSNVINALVESNTFEFTGSDLIPEKMAGRGSGAWFFQCTDIIAQHNVSRHARGNNDSYGMHIDYGNKNVLFQCNYSEDSEGGFVEILGNNINSIWRYNISVNDGLRVSKGNTIWISEFAGNNPVRSSENYVYNNSVYVGNGFTPDITIKSNDAYIYNNIFFTENNSKIGEVLLLDTGDGPLDVSNNMFMGDIGAGFVTLDANAIMDDPMYVQPGQLESEGYRLLKENPAYKEGEVRQHPSFPAAGSGIFSHITEEPQVDFFGNALQANKPSVGAVHDKGLRIVKLKGFNSCDNDSTGMLRWYIRNTNTFNVECSWVSSDNSQSGTINALPGLNYFYTAIVPGINTEKITTTWMDEKGNVKSDIAKAINCSNNAQVNNLPLALPRAAAAPVKNGLDIVFPNPVSKQGFLNMILSSVGDDEVSVELLDLSGRILNVQRKELSIGQNLFQLDLSTVQTADQLILTRVKIGEETFTKKVFLVD